jgi:hypothetical protein
VAPGTTPSRCGAPRRASSRTRLTATTAVSSTWTLTKTRSYALRFTHSCLFGLRLTPLDSPTQVSGSVDKTVRVWWDYEATAAPPITYSLHMHQAPIFHVRFNDYGNEPHPPTHAARARVILTTCTHTHTHTPGIRSAARDTELIEWDFYTPSLEDVHKTRRALLRPI